jgi:hypothetical protein
MRADGVNQADQTCSREAASARAARPLRPASASTVILAALSATVAPSRATSDRSLTPGGGTEAFADHDRDELTPRSFSVAVTVFQAAGLVQLALTAPPAATASAAGP